VGLTAVGQKVVGSVLSAGALVDVANLSDTAILDVLSLAKAAGRPVIATRGSAREVRNRPGSLSDWQLRGIASSGGVVGLSLDRDLLGDAQGAELGDVLRQVDHLLQVAGPESIAIASGFETGAVPLAAVNSATRFPRLAAALAAHGISDPQIRKLFRDNAVRVLCGSTTAANANGG
jgi:membrane dipeptidase